MLDMPLPKEALLVAQDLLHELERAGFQTGQIHLLPKSKKIVGTGFGFE